MFNWWKQEAKRTSYAVRQRLKSKDDNTVKNGKKTTTKSHIINSFLTMLNRSVMERICLQFFRTYLAPSSLDLDENLKQILSRMDRASEAGPTFE